MTAVAPSLHLECPFALAHNGLGFALFIDAVDIEFIGADHEIFVDRAVVPTSGLELLRAHLLPAFHGGAVGTPQGKVASRVLVEESIVEHHATLGNGRAVWHQSHLTKVV